MSLTQDERDRIKRECFGTIEGGAASRFRFKVRDEDLEKIDRELAEVRRSQRARAIAGWLLLIFFIGFWTAVVIAAGPVRP